MAPVWEFNFFSSQDIDLEKVQPIRVKKTIFWALRAEALGHFRQLSQIRNQYKILLDYSQLYLGVGYPILEFPNRPLPHAITTTYP